MAALLLVLVTGLAAALRLWRLDAVPPGFHYDEALEALEAWRVLTVPGYHPLYFPGDFGLAPTFIYLSSLAFHFLPATPYVSRTMAAAVGIATVPAVYVLGRELVLADDRLPPVLPIMAAAVLAGLRWHLTFSRVAIEPILVPFYLTITLWALFYGLRTNRWSGWLALGAALGLGVYAYPAAWLLPPLALACVAGLALTQHLRLAGRWRGLALAGLVACLLAAPLALDFLRQPGLLLMRADQVAMAGSARSLAETLPAVGHNLLRGLGMFSVAGDLDPRSNIPGVPALDPLLGLAFYLGLILLLWRWRSPASVVLLLAACAMLANTVFSQYAPHFRRALGLTPLVALVSGLGLATLWRWRDPVVGAAAPRRPWLARPYAWLQRAAQAPAWRPALTLVVAATLLATTALSATAYFKTWGQSPDLFYAYDEGLWQIAAYASGLPPGQNILITPRPAKDATLAFAWRTGPDVRHFDGRAGLLIPAPGRDTTYIVVEHEDFRAAGLLAQLFPHANVDRVFRDRRGKTYARAFHVPAGSLPGGGPQNPADARWPGIDLLGYDLNAGVYHPGDVVYLQLWWRATAPQTTDWTVFTHLLGPPRADGSTLWAGKDDRPGQGSLPTTSWRAGDLILDEYQVQLAQDLPAGDYQIEIGLYNPAAGGQRNVATQPPGADHFIVGRVRVQ